MPKRVFLHKSPLTWFLVADGKQAQVYTRHRARNIMPLNGKKRFRHYEEYSEAELVPVPGTSWKAEALEDFEFGKDKLGRAFESASPTRHMTSPRHDIHEEIKCRFMKTIAEHLKNAEKRKQFDRLVVIAPPKMLGEFKKHLDKPVLERIAAELPKELSRFSNHDLTRHLKEMV